MSKHYEEYVWKEGLPYGIRPLAAPPANVSVTYKVISDPYHKRNSVEKYAFGKFESVVYDSGLFDFRSLKPALQTAWQKTTLDESNPSSRDSVCCHIRNEDDRLILIEKYLFEGDLCRSCSAFSPHGPLVSFQKIFYSRLGDAYNGVCLYDSNQHPVLIKKYTVDDEGLFATLLEENWNV